MNSKIVLFFVVLFFWTTVTQAQDKFCKVWYTQEGASKVQIYLGDDGKYYGKIVWLRDGFVNGKPLIDNKNPDESKRTQPWLGLQIISGLVKKSETEIVNGKIYDPTKGNYYSCKMTIVDNKLELRGYILGMPFLGRTTTWHLAEEKQQINNSTPPPATVTKSTTQPQ